MSSGHGPNPPQPRQRLSPDELERTIVAVLDVKTSLAVCWSNYGDVLEANGHSRDRFGAIVYRILHIDDIIDLMASEDCHAAYDLVENLRSDHSLYRISPDHISQLRTARPGRRHNNGTWRRLYDMLWLADYKVTRKQLESVLDSLIAKSHRSEEALETGRLCLTPRSARGPDREAHSATRSGAIYQAAKRDDIEAVVDDGLLRVDTPTGTGTASRILDSSVAEVSKAPPLTPKPSRSRQRKDKQPSPCKSPYFPTSSGAVALPKGHPVAKLKPLTDATLGLMQERCWREPFKLLINCMLLNRTKGVSVLPISAALFDRYPTPADLAAASQSDVEALVAILGLGAQRSAHMVRMAQLWCAHPPTPGIRYKALHYPLKNDGKGLLTVPLSTEESSPLLLASTKGRIIQRVDDDGLYDDNSCRGGTEISHLPGIGPYAYDAWRIFCRDVFRGLTTGYNGEGAETVLKGRRFEPEWKRIDSNAGRLPSRRLDKELRVFLVWMWLKEGVWWDPDTGEKRAVSDAEMQLLQRGEYDKVVPPRLLSGGSGTEDGRRDVKQRPGRRKRKRMGLLESVNDGEASETE